MLGKVGLALACAGLMGCGGAVDDRNVVTTTDLGVTGEACNQLDTTAPRASSAPRRGARHGLRYLPDSRLVLEVTCGAGTRRIAGYEGSP